MVDLEKGKPIDLLPDREAEALANWLKEHPGVEIISRDRASFYKDGAAQGAPQAIQVAGRWHILKNVREMLKKVFEANRQAITQATKELLENRKKAKPLDPHQKLTSKMSRLKLLPQKNSNPAVYQQRQPAQNSRSQ